MSTKIYTAYRVKKGHDLWETLQRIRKKAEKGIDGVLRDLAKSLLQGSKENKDLKRLILDLSGHKDADIDKVIDLDDVFYYMGEQYSRQQTSSQRDPFDFNVSVGVWQHKGWFLLIPYCDGFMRKVLDFMKRDKSLEDYSYWNNTDQPKNVSSKKWNERGEVWDIVREDWRTNLALEILTPQNYYLYNFWLDDQLKEASKKAKRKSKTKPRRENEERGLE